MLVQPLKRKLDYKWSNHQLKIEKIYIKETLCTPAKENLIG